MPEYVSIGGEWVAKAALQQKKKEPPPPEPPEEVKPTVATGPNVKETVSVKKTKKTAKVAKPRGRRKK